MPSITVSFTPLPVHVRTARLIALATARRAGVEEDLIDEIRYAVGEACARAVGINAESDQPVRMRLTDDVDRFTVEVIDSGAGVAEPGTGAVDDLDLGSLAAPEAVGQPGGSPLPDPLPAGFGLAVISGLVEDVSVTHDMNGTSVELSWPASGGVAATG